MFSAKCFDLRRFVRYKHSYKKNVVVEDTKNIFYMECRTYRDYLANVTSNKYSSVAEFDSVIGKISDKQAILTITLKKENFQFGFVIQKGDSHDVVNKVRALFRKLGSKMTNKIFNFCICDNGTEFASFYKIELDSNNNKIVSTFYTRAYKSSDKATCERLHEILRYVLPKSKSLDNLTQEQLDDIYSNINSYVRNSKGGRTPYELVKRKFSIEFLNAINIKRIQKNKVKLTQII